MGAGIRMAARMAKGQPRLNSKMKNYLKEILKTAKTHRFTKNDLEYDATDLVDSWLDEHPLRKSEITGSARDALIMAVYDELYQDRVIGPADEGGKVKDAADRILDGEEVSDVVGEEDAVVEGSEAEFYLETAEKAISEANEALRKAIKAASKDNDAKKRLTAIQKDIKSGLAGVMKMWETLA